MAKIQYLHDEGNGFFYICPDIVYTVETTNIHKKVDISPSQFKNKYINEQNFHVSEQVMIFNI